ncbi:MAG TPA: ADP/ATP-dependent (S)-NAD(P)H-hydrate dehydratase, partial [Actinomycetes bacterium]|nr:ADP/ATP-dependent (S)-NAD(P)H-hydrate dehydratase [Actinomycetes bacterium]
APAGLVRQHWPEVVVGEGRVQAWAVGSGGGGDAAARLKRAAEDGVPVVVDADALAELDQLDRLGDGRPPMLLTPHAGELARLVGADRDDVEARRLHHAGAAAREHDAVVLLKGSTTVVAHPDGRTRVNPTGTPALATAGSGDVLAGLCGALLAGGLDPFDAGSAGAWLHGLAGRLAAEGGSPVSAADVLAALPRAVAATAGD